MGGRGGGSYLARGNDSQKSIPSGIRVVQSDGTALIYRQGPGDEVLDAEGTPVSHLMDAGITYSALYESAVKNAHRVEPLSKEEQKQIDEYYQSRYSDKRDIELGMGLSDNMAYRRTARKNRLINRIMTRK